MTQARGTTSGATSPRRRGITPADLSVREGVSRGGARSVTTGAASATGTDTGSEVVTGAEIATGAETVTGTGIATGAETAATAGAMAMGVGRAGEVARATVGGAEVVAVTEG